MEVLRLESARDGGVFELARQSRQWWQATLTLPGLSATARVSPDSYGVGEKLSTFFGRLAADWRGWDGNRSWATLEGEYDFNATHDGLGHVALRVRLRSGPYPEDWEAAGVIWFDAGQLERTAQTAKAFDAT